MSRGAILAALLLLASPPVLPAEPRPWTIGLFAPANGAGRPLGEEMTRGARLAIEAVNRSGGIAGRPLRLVEAASDLPWEGATRELVRILYEEEAVAVIGASDGRSAHLAEQIVTRARGTTLFLTPWATETTLTRVRIPWFFQIVPDDRRQAAALARELFQRRGAARVALLTEDTFDGRSRSDAILRLAPPGSMTPFPQESPEQMSRLVRDLVAGAFGALVLAGSPEQGEELLRRLGNGAPDLPILATLNLARPGFLERLGAGDSRRVRFAFPEGYGRTSEAERFGREYRHRHGNSPGPPAALSYDAVRLVAMALGRTALRPSGILAEELAALRWEGASGPIRFDRFLGREGEPILGTPNPGTGLPEGSVPGEPGKP